MGASLIGVERITSLMVKARIYEGLYLSKNCKSEIEQTLKAELIELYADMLRFLVMAKACLQKKGVGRSNDESTIAIDRL